jgi:hypothetical protein
MRIKRMATARTILRAMVVLSCPAYTQTPATPSFEVASVKPGGSGGGLTGGSREMLEHYSHIRIQAKRDAVAALERKPAQAETAATPATQPRPS